MRVMHNNRAPDQADETLKRTLGNVFWVSVFVSAAILLGVVLFWALSGAPRWAGVIIAFLLALIVFVNEALKESHQGI